MILNTRMSCGILRNSDIGVFGILESTRRCASAAMSERRDEIVQEGTRNGGGDETGDVLIIVKATCRKYSKQDHVRISG